MRIAWYWCLIAGLSLGCNLANEPDPGRMSLALGGQFVPGELTSLDVFIYDAEEVDCDADLGALSTEPSANVESATNISLTEPQEIAFSLPTSTSYVIYARAGRRDGATLDIVARGCETIELSRQAEVSVYLHRVESCGDGDIDPQEMCDGGDGCDSHCRTTPFWANDIREFREDRQDFPLAAGDEDLLALCWRSAYIQSQQAPMAWFDSEGNDGVPFLQNTDWNRRNCTSVDVRGDRVLMTYFIGDGLTQNLDGELRVWLGQNPLDPVEIGERADNGFLATFVGFEDLVTVSTTPIGLLLRSTQIADGALVISDSTHPVDDDSRDAESPAIAGGDGNFVVAWEDGNDVLARYFDDVDDPMAVIDLCQDGYSCSEPAVASLRGQSGDQYLVVYIGSNERVVGRFIDLLGSASAEFEISTEGGCREPIVEPLDDDRQEFLVAWTQATGDSNYPSRIYSRIVTDIDEFGQMATGEVISEEPFLVSPESGTDADQPAIATSFGTPDPSTALIFYRALQGIDDGTEWDIGVRLVRAARIPGES